MQNLEALGKEVARQQDEAVEHHRVVERTAAALHWPEPRKAGLRRWWVALALVVMVLSVGATLVVTRERPLVIETPGLASGAWLTAETEQPVAFSGGATLLMQKGSRFKVAQLTPSGAHVSVEHGQVSVSVPHREDTRWTLEVGPFIVKVVGTRFDTGWDVERQTFSLSMHDGAVVVLGPDGQQTQYVAGQAVTRSLKVAVVAVPPPAQSPPETPELEAPSEPEQPNPRAKIAAWKTLAKRGRYVDALAAAQRVGWKKLCATVPAVDLALLGDVARLSGDAALAREAYQQARARFPRSRTADAATFFLGRLAFNADDGVEAARWFERYHAEFPAGAFGAEALGRRIELAKRSGEVQRARQLATQYLAQFPTGPHSRLAKAVLLDH